jgi:hypothetical protein
MKMHLSRYPRWIGILESIPAWAALTGYGLVHIVLSFFIRLSFQSDSLYYYKLAHGCLTQGTWYPAPAHLYQDYIIAPLYINFTILIMKIFPNPDVFLVSNTVLNLASAVLVYFILKTLYPNRIAIARLGLWLYIFYLTSLGAVFLNFTDFLFSFFLLLSLLLFYHGRIWQYVLSGVFLACAIAVRPTGIALLIAYLFYAFYAMKKNPAVLRKVLWICAGVIVMLSLFGAWSHYQIGRVVVSSTSGSANILIGANDHATGTFNGDVFDPGNAGYLAHSDSLTFVEKDAFFTRQVVQWIRRHPVKWLLLMPVKLVYLYGSDDWSIFTLTNQQYWNLYRVLKTVLKDGQWHALFQGESPVFILWFAVLYFVHHLCYFILLGLGLFSMIYVVRQGGPQKQGLLLPVVAYIVVATLMTIVVFGAARFKYPMMLGLILLIPPFLLRPEGDSG